MAGAPFGIRKHPASRRQGRRMAVAERNAPETTGARASGLGHLVLRRLEEIELRVFFPVKAPGIV